MAKGPRNLTTIIANRLGEPLFKLAGRRGGEALNLAEVRNLLIVRLDEIGDLALTSPLLRSLRRALPQAHITLVVKPSVRDLVEHCPHVNEVLAFHPGSPGRLREARMAWRALRFAGRNLRGRSYDLAILPRFDADFAAAGYLAYFSGARWRLGFSERSTEQRRQLNRHYDRLITHLVPPSSARHEVQRNLDVARALGAVVAGEELELWLGFADQAFAEDVAMRHRAPGTLLMALGIGASHGRRLWPLERFAELGRALVQRYDARLIAVGGPDEKFLGLELRQRLGDVVFNLVGQTTLRQTAAVLGRCDYFIGGDSGPMHLAAAGGVPCVEISCHPASGSPRHPNAPARFHPWNVPHRVIQPREALEPCGEGCQSDDPHCILSVGVEQVLAAVDDLRVHGTSIAQRRGSPPRELPSISIVVPNYNGGKTLAATLQCLLDQQYPRLEIIVVDGGSTDDSVAIIRRYEKHIAWWVSEKDGGQTHAINKGFARATGEIVNWLCSDDLLMPGALRIVGEQFARSPDVDVLVGRTAVEYLGHHDRNYIDEPSMEKIDLIPINNAFSQQSCFYRRRLLDRAGPLNESLHYAMDLELWAYFRMRGARWKVIDEVLGVFRNSESNKTSVGGEAVTYEFEQIYRRYCHERVPLTVWHRRLRFPLEKLRHHHPDWTGFVIARPLQILLVLILGPFYGFKRVRTMNWGSWI